MPVTNEKSLSFNKFINICIDRGLFSEEKTDKFLLESNETFEEICLNFDERVGLLKKRFIKGKQYNARIKKIIEILTTQIKNIKNSGERDKKIAWLSYRLVEEESKKVIIDRELEIFLPLEFRELSTIYNERILF